MSGGALNKVAVERVALCDRGRLCGGRGQMAEVLCVVLRVGCPHLLSPTNATTDERASLSSEELAMTTCASLSPGLASVGSGILHRSSPWRIPHRPDRPLRLDVGRLKLFGCRSHRCAMRDVVLEAEFQRLCVCSDLQVVELPSSLRISAARFLAFAAPRRPVGLTLSYTELSQKTWDSHQACRVWPSKTEQIREYSAVVCSCSSCIYTVYHKTVLIGTFSADC